MGNSESSGYPVEENGYLIVKVCEGSPAYFAGLHSYFDYIIKINDTLMTSDPNSLIKTIQDCGDEPMNVLIYNSKYRCHKNVTVKRNPNWEGSSILGVNCQFCNISQTEANVWHVLEVYYGSPADIAGLRPYTDYIIDAEVPLTKEEDLYYLIEENNGSSLKFIVYNSETDVCREVCVAPNNEWNSKKAEDEVGSLLGCGIGYGYLHRIPVPAAIQPIPTKSAPIEPNNPATEVIDAIKSPIVPVSASASASASTNEIAPNMPAYPNSYPLPNDQEVYESHYSYGGGIYAIPYTGMPPHEAPYQENGYNVIPNPHYQPQYDPNMIPIQPDYDAQYMPYPPDQIIIESSKEDGNK